MGCDCNDGRDLQSLLTEWVCGQLAAPTVPPPDYEYITNTVCDLNTDTWHFITTPYVDAVAGTPVDTDSGIPCSEPIPIEPDIEKIDVCDAATGTIHVIVTQYSYPDPTDVTNVVTTVLSDTDTGVPCGEDVVDDETVVVCNGGFYEYHTFRTTNGVRNPVPTVEVTTIACPAPEELDLIKTNWLPFCVDGVQWYAQEVSVYNNIQGTETGLVTVYKESIDGAIVAVKPTGTEITDGYCVEPPIVCDITRETYRIAGTAAGTSTPLTTGGGGTVGNTVTITAPFKSISTHILRQTMQDPGDGSVATTTIDGVTYYMGAGNAYVTYLPDWGTDDCQEIYTEDMTFTVTGESYVEIHVTYR